MAVPKPAASFVHRVTPDDERLSAAGEVFRMLSDPTRLHILWMLAQGPADVTALAEACTASRTSVSQHLAKLRFSGMIEATKDGRRVVYRAVDGHLARLVSEGLNYADHRITGEPSHE